MRRADLLRLQCGDPRRSGGQLLPQGIPLLVRGSRERNCVGEDKHRGGRNSERRQAGQQSLRRRRVIGRHHQGADEDGRSPEG